MTEEKVELAELGGLEWKDPSYQGRTGQPQGVGGNDRVQKSQD